MKNLLNRLKKLVKNHEDLTCLRYGIKPYLKLENINIITYDINENTTYIINYTDQEFQFMLASEGIQTVE